MGRHELMDTLVARMGGLYGESLKFFRRGLESPHVGELIRRTEIPELDVDGAGEQEVTASAAGERLTTRFSVLSRAEPRAPVLLFHHGSGDCPYHSRIRSILGDGLHENGVGDIAATVIATDSPFNRTRKEYYDAVGDLRSFATMLALSAALMESLVRAVRARAPRADGGAVTPGGCSKVTVSGISLGGWVANLHHAYFGSADEYRPIFAGAAPDALFLDSAYARLASHRVQEDPEAVTHALNFEDAFRVRDNAKVFPLMARYDQYVRYERQSGVYAPENVTVMEKGHITGGAANGELRRFLLESLRHA
ncbi:MAG: hypothetical protein ACLFO1_04460 [Spirochaetaceae bacterium]